MQLPIVEILTIPYHAQAIAALDRLEGVSDRSRAFWRIAHQVAGPDGQTIIEMARTVVFVDTFNGVLSLCLGIGALLLPAVAAIRLVQRS